MPLPSATISPLLHRRRSLLALFLTLATLAAAPAAAAATHDVHTLFLTPSGNGSSTAVVQRVAAKLRQSASVQVVGTEKLADAVLSIDAIFWPIGSMTLNPHSTTGTFTNYEGYASVRLTAPSGQVLWSYLATPQRFKLSGIVDNLAGQITEQLLATLKTGIAIMPAESSPASPKGPALRAAGATFPAPLYLKWFQSFAGKPGGTLITYDAVGSVRGTEALVAGTVDIAATDIPPDSTSSSSDASFLHLPSVAGGIVPIYNLAAARDSLNLTGDVLADIYSGKIARWNAPRIQALNRNTRLPDAAIAVVHRSDGSGSTFVWSSYLALSSPDWKSRVGATIDWPTGIGRAGNGGVADAVATAPNSIGYVEMTFAIQHHLPFAGVRNPAGRIVKASLESVTAAALGARSFDSTTGGSPHNGSTKDTSTMGGSILNGPDKDAYPIATFTWLVLPATNAASHSDPQRRASIKRFLQWMLSDGQRECSELGYTPLPRDLIKQEQRLVDSLD